jgi:hypothetical protein
MKEKEPIVYEIRKDRDKYIQDKWNKKLAWAKGKYYRDKRRGDYSVVVDEWDDFLLEKERYEIKKNEIKGEMIMSKRRVLVRLSKAFNNVEVEVDEINSVDEFVQESTWAKNEAFNLINQLPDEQLGKGTKSTPVAYTKQHTQPVGKQVTPSNGTVTRQDITTKFLKGGQFNIALKGIQDGKFTLAQVNALDSWDAMQSLIFAK